MSSASRTTRYGIGAACVAAFVVYHYWRNEKKKNLEIMQNKNKKDKKMQNKMRKAQRQRYIKKQTLLINGYMHQLDIWLFLADDISELIIAFYERRVFDWTFNSKNTSLSLFPQKLQGCFVSSLFDFNGIQLEFRPVQRLHVHNAELIRRDFHDKYDS